MSGQDLMSELSAKVSLVEGENAPRLNMTTEWRCLKKS